MPMDFILFRICRCTWSEKEGRKERGGGTLMNYPKDEPEYQVIPLVLVLTGMSAQKPFPTFGKGSIDDLSYKAGSMFLWRVAFIFLLLVANSAAFIGFFLSVIYTRFIGKTHEEMKCFLGLFGEIEECIKRLPFSNNTLSRDRRASPTLPDYFDSRYNWMNCSTIGDVPDQSACGSCWAVSAAAVMSDRTCISSGQSVRNLRISSADILSCCGRQCGYGCDGGWRYEAFRWWISNGVVSGGHFGDKSTCKPYPFACGSGTSTRCPDNGFTTPKCLSSCQQSYTSKSYLNDKNKGRTVSAFKGAEIIRHEIFANGPVVAAFKVFSDFFYYKSGIYLCGRSNEYMGGHAVKIVGWGIEQGVPYWLCTNSWGYSWGESGMFRILRGNDTCGIESAVTAGNL